MTVDLRDLITAASVLVALVGMLLVNRNAKRALRPAAENTDLTRIRDLRNELRETRDEVDALKRQVAALDKQLIEANDFGMVMARERAEMLRYGRMPGVTMDDWLARFDQPPAVGGRIDG